ncbi:MAG TPA: TolC family protein [Vicinamibacterales bacterium]|nr:TolC family protein [Vicinamibacterales bacterium]
MILRSLTIAVILAAVLLSPKALLAQPQPQPEPPPPPVVPPRVGVTGTAPAAITIQDAIQMALEHNTDVAIARLAREAAEQDIRAAEGVYDVRLLPTFSYQRTVSPSTSELSGGAAGRLQERRLFGGVGVDALSPWGGGQLTVDFSGTRLESSNQFLRLNPQFPSAFGVSFTQPLLRGFRINPARRQILLTRRAADLTAAQVSTVLMEQLALVEQAYWDVVFATRFLEVQVTALGQAQGQVASNERQAQQGTLAPIDVVEAETQAATFRQSVATAQQALAQAENRLKRLVLANRNAALWSQALVPTEPSDRDLPSITVEEALKLALAQRPELRESQVALEQNAIEQRFLADEARPRVDLVGTYTLSGLAGTALSGSGSQLRSSIDPAVLARLNALSALAGFDPVTLTPGSPATLPGFLSGGLGESMSSIWARRFPTALAQVQVDLPIRNRTARANVARGLIARRELERRRDQTEQTVEADVRNALQAVESSRSRLDAASSARRNAQEQYESERRRFESGLSTVFLVLQRQTALVTAQGQEVRARTELNQAVALFDRATGGTLARYGVVLAD